MKQETFLGTVERNGNIYIPWRGTHIANPKSEEFQPGQNLLVTLEIADNTICAEVAKVELPTMEQLAAMKEELASDWQRFELIFRAQPMSRKVDLLRAMDLAVARWAHERG